MRRVLVPFGVSFPGCEDPTDISSHEEEILVFAEDVAELFDDLDDEQLFEIKFMTFLFLHFMHGLQRLTKWE
jgi:hypothetical protein